MKKVNILFLIDTLGGGGAERVMVNLVNFMDKARYNITVISMFGGGVNSKRLMPHIKYVERKFLHIKGLSLIFKFLPSSLLYNIFVKEKYDVIVAYMQGPSSKVLAGCNSDNVLKIAWLHSDSCENYLSSCWLSQSKCLSDYNNFDAVCGVSSAVVSSYNKLQKNSQKSYVVYNTNDVDQILLKSKSDINFSLNNCINISTAGRLVEAKGYDRLVNVAKKLSDEGYCFNLFILGDGPQKDELTKQIADLNANQYIHLLGFCDNPYAIMSKTDFFVSSSRWEGLSTVVTEAIILGLPVVATDVSGTKEVLGENSEYGIVTENDEAGIYQGLKKLLDNKELLLHYREKAKERADKFKPAATVAQVENLIESLIKR